MVKVQDDSELLEGLAGKHCCEAPTSYTTTLTSWLTDIFVPPSLLLAFKAV
jgi:hypothetical protein